MVTNRPRSAEASRRKTVGVMAPILCSMFVLTHHIEQKKNIGQAANFIGSPSRFRYNAGLKQPLAGRATALMRHRFAVAPMMDYTDQHCRMLFRLLSRASRLYTEMITAAAIVHGRDRTRFLAFDLAEEPLTLQLGGSDPGLLATAARHAQKAGFQDINLNVGCPSDRVTTGRFGACLMAEPELVAGAVSAMADATGLPVTVKCRLGIDHQGTRSDLDRLITTV